MNTAWASLGLSILFITGVTTCTVLEGGDAHNRRRALEDAFQGKIAYTFRNPGWKFQPCVVMVDSTRHSIQNAEIFELLQPGAYLSKTKGSLAYVYVNGGDTTVFFQQYSGRNID